MGRTIWTALAAATLATSTAWAQQPASEDDLRTRVAEQEKSIGADHPDALRSKYQLGRLLLDQGKLADAEPLLTAAFAVQEKKLGADKVDTLLSNAQLVRLYRAKKDAAKLKEYGDKLEAVLKTRASGAVVRQLRAMTEKEVPGAATAAATTTSTAATPTATAPAADDAAEKKLRDNLAAAEKALGAEHPDTLAAARELGAMLADKNKLADAEPLLKRASDGFSKGATAFGAEHGKAVAEISRLLSAQGNKRGAEELGGLAAAILQRSLANDRTKLAEAMTRLTQSGALVGSAASPAGTYDANWAKALKWRTIGPTAMGGRVVAVSVYEKDPSIWYVASASGGLFKTTNAGTTFTPVFEREATVSLGDVCVSQSNADVVWVGTGEGNARNSASWGDGVYKSTDGGKKWTNMGLKQSFQIGRILIHPTNPDVVYVGALGRLWGTNDERGVYKTEDGGKTWKRILFVDAKTGCIDMAMKPDDPETIVAAMYERQRDNTDDNDPIKRWGPGAGIHKTTDGGKTWKKLGKGLPTTQYGRVGFNWYRANPNVLYAVVETEKSGENPSAPKTAPAAGKAPPAAGAKTAPPEAAKGAATAQKSAPPTAEKTAATPERRPGSGFMGIMGENAEGGAKLTQIVEGGGAANAGLKVDDLVVELAGKPVKSYDEMIETLREAAAGDKLALGVKRGAESLKIEVTMAQRPGGGAGGGRQPPPGKPFGTFLGGQVQNIQDRQGPEGFQTGGVFRSADAGETWTRVNSLTPRPFYFSKIRVDPQDEKNIYVLGIQLHVSKDGGKTFSGDGGRNVHSDHHAMWIDPKDPRRILHGCDGGLYFTSDRMEKWDFLGHLPMAQFYHVAVDTRTPYRVYGGLQDNQSWGAPSMTRTRSGPTNNDWINLGGGDGFVCAVDPNDPDLVYWESQNGALQRTNIRTGEGGGLRPQAPAGGRARFNWKTPFILSSHNSKVYYAAGNYVFRSMDRGNGLKAISPEISNTKTGTAAAIAESPLDADVLYVGTDDGALWVTRNGGQKWTNVKDNLKKLVPDGFWVDTLECSRFAAGRVYAALDCHRVDNDEPFPVVSEDYGVTWKSLRGNLPSGSTRTVREDRTDENVLYCGTEFGLWISIDRGKAWTKLPGLPTVAVHETAQPTTAEELVVATHGRGMWILELAPVRQASAKVVAADAHLFKPAPAVLWSQRLSNSPYGHRGFFGENPTTDAVIYFALKKKAEKLSLKVLDVEGKSIRELTASREPGLHRVTWDRRRAVNPVSGFIGMLGGGPPAGQRGQGGGQGGGRGPGRRATFVDPGNYRVVLTVDGKEYSQSITVGLDPDLPIAPGDLDELMERIEETEIRMSSGGIR